MKKFKIHFLLIIVVFPIVFLCCGSDDTTTNNNTNPITHDTITILTKDSIFAGQPYQGRDRSL